KPPISSRGSMPSAQPIRPSTTMPPMPIPPAPNGIPKPPPPPPPPPSPRRSSILLLSGRSSYCIAFAPRSPKQRPAAQRHCTTQRHYTAQGHCTLRDITTRWDNHRRADAFRIHPLQYIGARQNLPSGHFGRVKPIFTSGGHYPHCRL